MTPPLVERPQWQPLLTLLKREGWALPLFGLIFVRGMHGLPAVIHALFLVRKSDIQAQEPLYSRHDLWVLHSGLWSTVSAVLLVLVIIRWTKLLRHLCGGRS